MVPAWFHARPRRAAGGRRDRRQRARAAGQPIAYRASLNLPGTELFLRGGATERAARHRAAHLFSGGAAVSGRHAGQPVCAAARLCQAPAGAERCCRPRWRCAPPWKTPSRIGLRAWDRAASCSMSTRRFAAWWATRQPSCSGSSAPAALLAGRAGRRARAGATARHLRQGTSGKGVEVQFQHRDGHLIDVLIHEAPLNAGQRRADRLDEFGARHQRAQARRAAWPRASRKSSKPPGRLVAVGEVASTLAHELNQPLGALSSFANGLLNRLRGGSISWRRWSRWSTRMERLAEQAGRHHPARQRLCAAARNVAPAAGPGARCCGARVARPGGAADGSTLALRAAGAPSGSTPTRCCWSTACNNLVRQRRRTGRARAAGAAAGAHRAWSDPASRMAVLPVADTGPGVREEDADRDLQRLCQPQRRRHGHGAGDLPLHRRGAPRPHRGRPRRRAGRRTLYRVAAAGTMRRRAARSPTPRPPTRPWNPMNRPPFTSLTTTPTSATAWPGCLTRAATSARPGTAASFSGQRQGAAGRLGPRRGAAGHPHGAAVGPGHVRATQGAGLPLAGAVFDRPRRRGHGGGGGEERRLGFSGKAVSGQRAGGPRGASPGRRQRRAASADAGSAPPASRPWPA